MPHLRETEKLLNLPNGTVAASGVFGGYCTQTGATFCEVVPSPGRCPNCPASSAAHSETAADITWLEWLMRVEAATGRDVNGYQLGDAYSAHRNGVTASDYALEVVARAGELG